MIQKTVNLISLTKQCKTLNQLKQIHAHVIISELPENPFAIGPVLSIAANLKKHDFFSHACAIFRHADNRNTFLYNTMIRSYVVQAKSPKKAISCYLEMLSSEIVPNHYTFPPLIKACSVLSNCFKFYGHFVHAHVVIFGFGDDPFVVSALIEYFSLIREMGIARLLFDKMLRRDVVVWTAMIDGYGKIGDVTNARMLFDEMPERNTISWSAMMASYSRVSDFREVLRLFKSMQEVGTKPNESVLVSVLTACAHLGTLNQGMWVHSYVKRAHIGSNPVLATALVNMYSKCGCVDMALSVFEAILDKDTGAWNAMISGVAMNGDARKSIELFSKMVACGTRPTETTFVTVLSACTHAKLVTEGLKLYQKMGTLYRVEPQSEHCACVVDLLAKADMLEEAEKFIEEKMGGLKGGDVNVWGALLSACRSYGNFQIANRIWKRLVNMGVDDFGIHVLSYNIFREAGQDNEAKRARRSITEVGKRKKPGCSVIEVDGVADEFLAGDLSHPQANEISKMLNCLFKVTILEEKICLL